MWRRCTTTRYCQPLKLFLRWLCLSSHTLPSYCSENSLQSKPPVMIHHMGNWFSRTKHQCSNSTKKKKTRKQPIIAVHVLKEQSP
jgi:hypothetical protein